MIYHSLIDTHEGDHSLSGTKPRFINVREMAFFRGRARSGHPPGGGGGRRTGEGGAGGFVAVLIGLVPVGGGVGMVVLVRTRRHLSVAHGEISRGGFVLAKRRLRAVLL